MRNGDYETAMPWFKSALWHIKSFIAVHDQDPGLSPIYKGLPSSSHILAMPADVLLANLPPVTWKDMSQTETESQFYTFTSGIPCVPGHRFFRDLMEEGIVVSAVTIFNLALTTHLSARDSGCSDEWKRAQSLYRDALRILAPIIDRQGRTPIRNAAFDLLTLALLNNMVVAKWECHEFNDAMEVFGTLANLSALVTSSFVSPRTCPQHDQRHEPRLYEALQSKVQRMVMNAIVGASAATSAWYGLLQLHWLLQRRSLYVRCSLKVLHYFILLISNSTVYYKYLTVY